MANTSLIQDLRQDWKREFFALVLYFSYNLNYFCLPFKTEKNPDIFKKPFPCSWAQLLLTVPS